MTEIVKILPQKIGEESSQTISARDLYKFLGVKKDFSDWIKVQINRKSFKEDRDFIVVWHDPLKGVVNILTEIELLQQFNNLQQAIRHGYKSEYFLTLETAKHIAVISNTDKGEEVREYFLKVEKEYIEQSVEKRIKIAVEHEIKKFQKQCKHYNLVRTRLDGKTIRRLFTDTIKKFVAYAKSQGSQNADRYYLLFTLQIYRSLGLIKTNKDFSKLKNNIADYDIELNDEDLKKFEKQFNLRNELDIENLTVISSCELIAQRVIEDEISKQTPYKQIFQIVKQQLGTIEIAFEPYIATAKQQLQFKNTLFEFLLLENK